jgi:hypothetical protein
VYDPFSYGAEISSTSDSKGSQTIDRFVLKTLETRPPSSLPCSATSRPRKENDLLIPQWLTPEPDQPAGISFGQGLNVRFG